MRANAADWTQFYADFKRKTGLDLDLYKANQLQRRILSMAESKNCQSLPEFWRWMQAPGNVQWFMDRLAINVSEMFRNPEKWRELETQVIPDLLKESRRLKIWSAGCSYGAEAHSLAMLLDARFPGSHTIIGTDIDEAALAQARRSEFNDADIKGVPRDLAQKYVRPAGDKYTVEPGVKKYLNFKRQNLLGDAFEGGFDLIMCRNVVIYFTEEAKSDLYKKFLASLRPGGVLFVGSTERIFKSEELGFESYLPFFYRKPQTNTTQSKGEQRWRSAS